MISNEKRRYAKLFNQIYLKFTTDAATRSKQRELNTSPSSYPTPHMSSLCLCIFFCCYEFPQHRYSENEWVICQSIHPSACRLNRLHKYSFIYSMFRNFFTQFMPQCCYFVNSYVIFIFVAHFNIFLHQIALPPQLPSYSGCGSANIARYYAILYCCCYCYCICCCRFCCIAFLAIMNAIFKFSALIIATSGSEYSRVRACEGEYFKAKRFAYQPFRKSFLLNICIRIATAYSVYGNMQML